ncbi:MAG TPA: glycogen synthase [Acidimicrobiales bacterium]
MEELGGGHALSGWCEQVAIESADAVIAVSEAMRRDVLTCYPAVDPERVFVIHNGVDAGEYRPDPQVDVLLRYGIDPGRPLVLFVGRLSRQKGIPHLLDAATAFDPAAQLVLCTGAPDSADLTAEIGRRVHELQASRGNVVWLAQMLPKAEVVQLLSHATVFVCPSIYEPLGIVNLEAMACEAAVVATATGGMVEVVDDGVTGLLVPYEPVGPGAVEPSDPAGFATAIANCVNALLADPRRAASMGRAGRERVLEAFSWSAAARRTVEIYSSVGNTRGHSDQFSP